MNKEAIMNKETLLNDVVEELRKHGIEADTGKQLVAGDKYEDIITIKLNDKVSASVKYSRLLSYIADNSEPDAASIAEGIVRSLDSEDEVKRIAMNSDVGELVKDRSTWFFRVLNFERNTEYLKDAILFKLDNTDLCYAVFSLVSKDDGGVASARVPLSCLDDDADFSEIFSVVKENTLRLFPLKVFSMEDLLRKSIAESISRGQSSEELPIDIDDFIGEIYEIGRSLMVATNTSKVNGATTAFLSHAYDIGEDEDDVIIFPSSVHEILFAKRNGMSIRDCIKMVREVNSECVADDEILSDNVYIFNRNGGLKVAKL